MEKITLEWLDYIAILIMIFISTGIGIYYRFTGNQKKTSAEYFIASKSMGIFPVSVALMVSFVSAITLLGLSSDSYSHGTMYIVFYVSFVLVVPLVCYGYFPIFHKLQVTSVYEYLERRFGKIARFAASWVNWIQLLLYSGICLYAPALALEVTTGLPQFWSILTLGIICAFYSSIGGIKAVLMTDVYQGLLMIAAIIMIIVTAAWNVGSLGEIWRIAEKGGRIELDNFSLDPTERHTWWSLTIGGLVLLLSLNGVNQVQVQRLMTVKTLSSARKAMMINLILYDLFGVISWFAGLAIYSKYYDCDPKVIGKITSYDQLMPLYVMDTLSHIPGLAGLFISGIFSAALSTISALLNSLAAISLEDYIKPIYVKCTKREVPESSLMAFGKLLAFAYGIITIGIAFSAQVIGSVLQTSLTINGSIGGTVLGIFTLGMLTETANESGAVFGLLTTLAFITWITFGWPRPIPKELPISIAGCEVNITTKILESRLYGIGSLNSSIREADNSDDDSEYFYLYRISYMWYGVIGFVGAFVLGLVASYLCRRCFISSDDDVVEKQLNLDLFFPFVANRIRRRRQKK